MELTIQDLGALGELLGSIAVLVTLIYLALQTRQNTAAISAQVDAAGIAATLNLNMSMASSDEILNAMIEDQTAESSRSLRALRLDSVFRAGFRTWQWQFIQGRRGLLPAYSDFFTFYSSFESWWEREGVHLVPEFVEFVEQQRAKAA